MNANELEDYFNGYEISQKLWIESLDLIEYISGQYQMYAYHDPKKYPKQQLLSNKQKNQVHQQTPEEIKNILMMWVYALGG